MYYSLSRLLECFDLTYQGLKLPYFFWNLLDNFVLILPMRDWNHVERQYAALLATFWSYLWGIEILNFSFWILLLQNHVLILPMRDWNISPSSVLAVKCTFWSYLSGIEICPANSRVINTYSVLILPMRDWNPTRLDEVAATAQVLILPMRDWNIDIQKELEVTQNPFWSYLWGIEIQLNWLGL